MTWLFYLVLLIVPLITWPASIDPFQIKTLIISITGFACLAYWITKEWKGIASIPLYFFWCLITFLFCRWKLGNSGEELLLLIAYLGVFLYAKDYLKTEKVIPVILVSAILALIYNFYLTGIHFARLEIGPSFVNANIYAGWLVLVLPVVLAWGFTGKWIKGVFGGLIFGFGLIALWMTGCRSAMLGLTAALAAFCAFYWGKRGMSIAGVIICLFGAIWWGVFPHKVLDPSRAHFWRGTLELMASKPWTGYGIGSFQEIYPVFKENIMKGADPNHFLLHCHNFSFEMISEIGIVGLLLFLFMIWRIWKRADKSNPLNLAMIAGTFGFLIDNFYNITFYYSAVGMIFWLYLALLASDTKKVEAKDGKGWLARLSEWADFCFND